MGRLVAFEGVDGSGKSTQVELLEARLKQTHPEREVCSVREPGGTPLGEALRSVLLQGAERGPMAEMLLYLAARAELYERVILPALARGAIVIADRGNHSTAAYQGAGLGMGEAEILAWGGQVVRDRWPDKVVWLRLAPDLATARLPGRSADSSLDQIETRGPAYFRRVSEAYGRFAAADPEQFLVVDASLSAEDVAAAVWAGLVDVL